jgi:uncharacterized membrane protein
MVIGFDQFEATGEALDALMAASDAGAIRVIDLQFVSKDEAGNIEALELSGLTEDEAIEFGAVIGGLLGAGAGGDEGMVEGAIAGAEIAAEGAYGMTAEDVIEIAAQVPPGGAAAILAIEHTWAIGFRDAIVNQGGMLMGQGFLTRDAMLMIGAEAQAMADALDAIVISEAIQEQAAMDAADAVALSDIIQLESARLAAESLVAAALIEEAAFEEAATTVLAALEAQDEALAELEGGMATDAEEALAAVEKASADEE